MPPSTSLETALLSIHFIFGVENRSFGVSSGPKSRRKKRGTKKGEIYGGALGLMLSPRTSGGRCNQQVTPGPQTPRFLVLYQTHVVASEKEPITLLKAPKTPCPETSRGSELSTSPSHLRGDNSRRIHPVVTPVYALGFLSASEEEWRRHPTKKHQWLHEAHQML